MADYQSLAERLLSHPGPYGIYQSATLLLGEVPADLPLDLPPPPGGQIIGSVVRTSNGRTAGVEVVVDAPGSENELLDFYQREISRQGWDPPARGSGRPPGGFMPVARAMARTFCRSAQGPWIAVSCVAFRNGVWDVRLRLELTHPGPCAAPPGGPPEMPAGTLLPPLQPPSGIDFRPIRNGGGPDDWASEALAESDLGAAELHAHFAVQIEAGGWRREAGGVDGPLAWSSWRTTQDGEWEALLLVLETPGQRRRTLLARVASLTARPGPWFGGGPSARIERLR